jgi:dihydrofolate reductase
MRGASKGPWRRDKFTPFAQVLAGGFASTTGIATSGLQNHFALGAGGGVDIQVTKLIAIRPVQAEYFLTTIPDGLNNRQNSFRFSAGVVFRLGKKQSRLGRRSSLQEAGMKVSVFIGTSVDGFIARTGGELDFLPEGGGEPHGYPEFMASVDALVIGRNTFEIVLAFPEWPYGEKRVVVLSSKPLDFSGVRGGVVEQMSGAPADIVKKLAASGVQHVYVDGGITVQRFLREGLVDRMIVTRVPVLIGEGIPLFGALGRDVRLRHVATQAYASGLVKTEYEVER